MRGALGPSGVQRACSCLDQFRNLFLQCPKVSVVYALTFQGYDGLQKILGTASPMPAGLRQAVRNLIERELTCVIGTVGIGGKRDCRLDPIFGLNLYPLGIVARRPHSHFTPPQLAEDLPLVIGRDGMKHAITRPAAVDLHHESGALGCSAKSLESQAEPPLPAKRSASPACGGLEHWSPDQRSICENIYGPGWSRLKELPQVFIVLLLREEIGSGPSAAVCNIPVHHPNMSL